MHNQLRIIAGKWGGRRISIAKDNAVRPTKDRVRETLFNWLNQYLAGARCLDLFAGSGALGFEALSRGASQVVMVDRSRKVIAELKANADILGVTDEEIAFYCGSVPKITLTSSPFDIVFLDPPFYQNLIQPICQWLEEQNHVREGSIVYLEVEKQLSPLPIPAHWEIFKSKVEGQVGYYLARIGV